MVTTHGNRPDDPLVQAVRQLAEDSRELVTDVRRLRRRNRWVFGVLVLVVGGGGFLMVDTRHAIHENNQRLCPVIVPFMGAQNPEIRVTMTRLAGDYGCLR